MIRLLALVLLFMPSIALAEDILRIEDMTSPEIAAKLADGWTTIIVPSGDTEQNGPHMVLGKHNVIVGYTADAIARRLGKTLVAPVMAYVPEGSIEPPQGHMRFPGTISLPEPVFAAVLEATARSFLAEGFKAVVFLGDSGGNQAAEIALAQSLDAEFAPRGQRVIAARAYYAENGGAAWLAANGYKDAEIGQHASIRDTSELMAVDPTGVRGDKLADALDPALGANGDPRRASAAIGQALIALKIDAAVTEIRAALAAQ